MVYHGISSLIAPLSSHVCPMVRSHAVTSFLKCSSSIDYGRILITLIYLISKNQWKKTSPRPHQSPSISLRMWPSPSRWSFPVVLFHEPSRVVSDHSMEINWGVWSCAMAFAEVLPQQSRRRPILCCQQESGHLHQATIQTKSQSVVCSSWYSNSSETVSPEYQGHAPNWQEDWSRNPNALMRGRCTDLNLFRLQIDGLRWW